MMYFEIDDYDALRCALKEMCVGLATAGVPEDAVFSSKLVADELLSNVLQHGGGRAYFRAERQGDEIRICVRSSNEYRPPEKSSCAGVYAECGRGLFLVDQYCVRRDYAESEGVRVYIKIER